MNEDFIYQKLKMIQIDIDKIDNLNVSSIQALEDYKIFHLVERLIEKIVDCAIDINQHILREQFNQATLSGKESFVKLGEMKVLSTEFANNISRSVGLRNTIIHQYQKLEEEILFRAIALTSKEYKKYCDQIIKWLNNSAIVNHKF